MSKIGLKAFVVIVFLICELCLSSAHADTAYILDTDKIIMEYDADLFEGLGAGTVSYFYDTNLERNIAGTVLLDDGRIIKVSIEAGDGIKIKRVQYPTGDEYWFLWGDDVYGSNDDVVIEKTVFGDWNAYNFTPDTQNLDVVLNQASWNFIESIANPYLLVLPELGDWWQYCLDQNIVPEFPPLSSDYTRDAFNRVMERFDHNDLLDTKNDYTWDYEINGRMSWDIYYDWGNDGTQNLIYSRIYANGTDYDLANISSWQLLQETNRLNGSSVYYTYYGSSLIRHYATHFNNYIDWQKTIEYYEDGVTMHYQWVLDPDAGHTGDPIYYEYDTLGRLTRTYLDTGDNIMTFYWDGTSPVKYIEDYFDSVWIWQKRIQYYADGTTMNYQWIKDPDSTPNGDPIYLEYDSLERVTFTVLDTGAFIGTYYWADTNDKYKEDYFLPGEGLSWEKTIEYWETHPGVTHYQWINDLDGTPDGDQIYLEYDESGRPIFAALDTGELVGIYYWGSTSNKYKEDYLNSDIVWEKTIEYWETYPNVIHYQWMADTGTPNETLYEVRDTLGRITDTYLDTGEHIVSTYWTTTGAEKQNDHFFDDLGAWQKTIEYWEDGVTKHYEWLADGSFYEYDHDGNPIGGSTLLNNQEFADRLTVIQNTVNSGSAQGNFTFTSQMATESNTEILIAH